MIVADSKDGEDVKQRLQASKERTTSYKAVVGQVRRASHNGCRGVVLSLDISQPSILGETT